MAYLLPLHILAVCLWVGGMFFAWMILRPSVSILDSAQRLLLWKGVLKRFFAWVWIAVLTILITGYVMLLEYFGGFAAVPLYINVMQGVFWVMAMLFMYVAVVLYLELARHVNNHDWSLGVVVLTKIRRIVGINIILGSITIVIASAGRFIT